MSPATCTPPMDKQLARSLLLWGLGLLLAIGLSTAILMGWI